METPAAAAVAVVDADGMLTSWSLGAQQLLHYSAAQVMGRPAAELLAGPLPETARLRLAASEGWIASVALRHHDHGRATCTLRALPLATGDGRTGWLLEATSAREAGGGADRDGEDRLLRWAFDQVPFVLGVFDTRGRLVRINRRFERNAKTTNEELRGLRLSEALHGPVFEADQAIVERVIATGEPEHVERYVHLPGEGRAHAWGTDLSPLLDSAGLVHGALLSALDHTEQDTARSRLALLNQASEHIGSSLDVTRTAQELADVAVSGYADVVSVDLLEAVLHGEEPPRFPPWDLCRYGAPRRAPLSSPHSKQARWPTTRSTHPRLAASSPAEVASICPPTRRSQAGSHRTRSALPGCVSTGRTRSS